MNRPTQAAAELCSIIGRVLDLKKQQDELGDDIREIYLEAPCQSRNRLADTERYCRRPHRTRRPHAHEAELPAHDPETGEVDVPAAPVKAAAKDREPLDHQRPLRQEADDAQPEGGISGGSRANSWQMDEDVPEYLRRVG